ncbi:MAG: hypothetical protein QNK04_28980 [Myxococcota bacterium]|nr:hypothetical protein [Myxococcota bacterium]
MPPRGGRRLLLLPSALLALPLLLGIGPSDRRHQDAVPSGAPPGFEPIDVSGEVAQIQRRNTRAMERQVDADIHYRRVTAEHRIRARYGAATWNLYDPLH